MTQLKHRLQQRWSAVPHIAAWLAVALMSVALWMHVDALVEQDRASAINNAVQNMSNLTKVAQEHALRTFRSADQALRFVKARYEEQGAALDLKKMVARGVIDVDIFNQVGIIDAKGIYVSSNLPMTPGLDLSDREHFKVHLASHSPDLFISKALLGRASKRWSIQLRRRINGKDGTFDGVAVVSIDAYYFTRFFGGLNLGLNGTAAMFGLDGEIRARIAGLKEEFAIKLPSSGMLASIASGNDSGNFTKISGIDGIERIYFYRRIPPYKIGIVIGLATEEVLLPYRQLRTGLVLQASLATLLIFILGCAFSWHQRRLWQEMNTRMLVKRQLATLNAELTLQAAQAEAANLAKSAFLANMSHELRTPMNAVIGIAYLLEKSPLSADASELVRRIGVAGRALLAIINDVLDLSKIEAERVEIAQLPFRLADVLDEVSSIMAFHAQQKQITLRITAPQPGNDRFCGDALRVKQVLLNLVGNGIKFTERGHVHVDIVVLAESEQRVTLRFAVSDTGIGITAGRLNAVFDAFSQEDDSITRRFGGTGLGLSISRRLVALMGGELGVTSVPGSGSQFWFTLAVERCAPSSEAGATLAAPLRAQDVPIGPRLCGVRMLVVDDSDINLDVARRIFEGEGAQVTLADNGQHALEWLQKHPDQLDVVLMDLQMPVMDGYQASRLIHATPELAGLPVIALSAGAFGDQEAAARDAGMTGFLSKPFNVDAAIELILCVRRPPQHMHSVHSVASASATASSVASAIGVFDAARGAQRWSDQQAHHIYLQRFVDTYGDAVGLMQASLATGDRVAAAALAHKLAGVAGNLGLPDTQRLASAAERVLATTNDPTTALTALRAALLHAVGAIAQVAPRPPVEPDVASVCSVPAGPTTLAALLVELMAALDGDDPGPVEPVLAVLARHVPKEQWEAIARCARDFDFRGAEAGVLTLAETLNLTIRK
ncbi:MAG: response regulator [Massilia sp.]|nr:response regulator [Massilia sp.]